MRHRRKRRWAFLIDQKRKNLGQHEWNEGVRTHCVKCRVTYRRLYSSHWNPMDRKTDGCVKPARTPTVNLKQFCGILKKG